MRLISSRFVWVAKYCLRKTALFFQSFNVCNQLIYSYFVQAVIDTSDVSVLIYQNEILSMKKLGRCAVEALVFINVFYHKPALLYKFLYFLN